MYILTRIAILASHCRLSILLFASERKKKRKKHGEGEAEVEKKWAAQMNVTAMGKHSSYVFLMYFEKPLNILKTTIKLH